MQGLHGYAWQVGDLPANHRASGCALEGCLEGFAVLDGHKSMPSRESMCPECPLEARRMAIAVQDELQERVGPGTNQSLTGL